MNLSDEKEKKIPLKTKHFDLSYVYVSAEGQHLISSKFAFFFIFKHRALCEKNYCHFPWVKAEV